jgi:hypothetical protein
MTLARAPVGNRNFRRFLSIARRIGRERRPWSDPNAWLLRGPDCVPRGQHFAARRDRVNGKGRRRTKGNSRFPTERSCLTLLYVRVSAASKHWRGIP